jgi:exopolyphosphatase/guanosine-5'-triphosphate,3'-diphosphate pyrophosphatase
MTAEERRHIPGLQPKRADVILAGLLIADAFMRHYDVSAIQISEHDLLEGVFYAL